MGGLRGFVAQGMDGRKSTPLPSVVAFKQSDGASGSYTATASVTALIYAYGAGATGLEGGTSGPGGGGGGAGYKRVRLNAGQKLSWSAGIGGAINGNPGGSSTVTLPTGDILTAGGGQSPAGGTSGPGGIGGRCSGNWDIARTGGQGGGSQGVATTTPGGGVLGGALNGGGGGAGFGDHGDGLVGGNGNGGNSGADASTAPGGAQGGGYASSHFPGRDGRVYVLVLSFTS